MVFADLGQDDWVWIVVAVPLGLILLHPRLFGPAAKWLLVRFGREPLDGTLSGREVLALIFPSGLGVREGVPALVLVRDLPGEVAIAVRFALTFAEVVFTATVVALKRRPPRARRRATAPTRCRPGAAEVEDP
jgi:hypothetical protein